MIDNYYYKRMTSAKTVVLLVLCKEGNRSKITLRDSSEFLVSDYVDSEK